MNPIKLSITLFCLFLWSCSSTPVSQVVSQQASQNKVLPILDINPTEQLAHYSFPIEHKSKQPLQVHFQLDTNAIYYEGGKATGYVALTTQEKKLDPISVHILIDDQDMKATVLDNFFENIKRIADKAPLTITVDCSFKCESTYGYDSWLDNTRIENNKVILINELINKSYDSKPHHILWLAPATPKGIIFGNDQLRYLTTSLGETNVSISVITYGDKPAIGTWSQIAEQSGGYYLPYTDSIKLNEWLEKDLKNSHKKGLEHISLNFELQTPTLTSHQGNMFTASSQKSLQLKKLELGELELEEQRISKLELSFPSGKPLSSQPVLKVTGSYFDPTANRFYEIDQQFKIRYAVDLNKTIKKANQTLEKFDLIIDYNNAIEESSRLIHRGEEYKAVALLNNINYRMKNYAAKYQDQEITFDQQTLDTYTQVILNKSSKWYNGLTHFYDQNLERYRWR